MIDIENLVLDTVYNGIAAVRNDVHVTRGFIEKTAQFPCVAIREIENAPVQRTDTDACAENYSRVAYMVEVYSDKAGTARSECRDLIKLVDGIMQGMKFRRQRLNEPLNVERTIYRQYARYVAIVQKGIVTEENGEETITFQMYRR